ncbi:MAG TPA: hypothetical protein VGG15_06730 [Terriglobales bacterium]|jgi:hypothetical protein
MPASAISVETVALILEQFLADYPDAVVTEEGALLFDFSTARYSLSGEGKCVLHLWSEERNLVRRVLDAELQNRTLRLQVLRFGQSQPNLLEICGDRQPCSTGSRRRSRTQYQKLLERVLRREYPGFHLDRLSSSPDLEHSISPVYTRGLLRAGQTIFAFLGLGADETQPSVDAALTFGILWMDYQRQQFAGRAQVEGLKLFLPPGRSEIVRQRAANLNQEAAKWQIFELDERAETVEAFDVADSGNIITRIGRAVDMQAARERFATSVARIHSVVPAAEIGVETAAEIVFRLHGLEFARARITPMSGSFRNSEAILFGLGPAEYILGEQTAPLFTELLQRLTEQRQSAGSHTSLFYRMAPERWLESLVIRQVRAIDERLDQRFVYSQVPAFAASDRAMLDLLTCTLEGRLAVLELKANEDIHLPLQGLDYWARVRWHQQHGEFARNGYFAGRELSSAPPILYLVAPALRVHPTTDVLLRYLSPRIEWSLAQLDERWREGVRVVNRKHPARNRASTSA